MAVEEQYKIQFTADVSPLVTMRKAQKEAADELLRLGANAKTTASEMQTAEVRYNTATNQLRTMKTQLSEVSSQHKLFSRANLENLENITIFGAGLTVVAGKLKDFGVESIMLAAKEESLRSVVKVSTQDMDSYKEATVGMVSETSLLKMVQYGQNVGKTKEQIVLAMEQARILSRVTGEDLPTSYNAVIKTTDGYKKSIASLGLSKTEYNAILKKELESVGGVVKASKDEWGEIKVVAANLTVAQQETAATTAFNKLFAKSYGDVKDQQITTLEKTEQLKNTWEEIKTGAGAGMIKALYDVGKNLGIVESDTKGVISVTEKWKTGIGDVISEWASFLRYVPNIYSAFLLLRSGIDTIVETDNSIGNLALRLIGLGDISQHEQQKVFTQVPTPFVGGSMMTDYSLPLPPGGVKEPTTYQMPDKKGRKPVQDRTDQELLLIDKIRIEIELAKENGTLTQSLLNADIAIVKSKEADLQASLAGNLSDKERNKLQKDLIDYLKLQKELEKDLMSGKAIQTPQRGTGIGNVFGKDASVPDMVKSLTQQGGNAGLGSLATAFAKDTKLIDEALASITGSFGGLFKAMIPPQTAHSAWVNFAKSIANTMINLAEAMLFGAEAITAAKGIASFGITLIKDFPLIAAGFVALEAARGFIGAFEQGGYVPQSGYALVGERGAELVHLPGGSQVYNNAQTNSMVGHSAPNVYINANLDSLSFMRYASPKYSQFKGYKRI